MKPSSGVCWEKGGGGRGGGIGGEVMRRVKGPNSFLGGLISRTKTELDFD